MRGARQTLALLIASFTCAMVLAGQQTKIVPAQKHSPPPVKSVESSDPGDLNRDTTFSLLREAYNTSRDLTSEQRIPLLAEICQISASMNSKTAETRRMTHAAGHRTKIRTSRMIASDLTKKQIEKLRDWSEELFQLGDEFPSDSQLRSQAETSAARAMVFVDPNRALQLLESIESAPRQNGWDPRTSVVSALFTEVYARKGAAAIPDIRREALSLGDQGSYPYFAVSNLLHQLHDNREVVRQFFADSVEYLRRGPATRQEIFGMVNLLSSDQIRTQLEDWQTQDAATELVSQVKEYLRTETDQNDSAGEDRGLVMMVKNSLKRFAPDAVASLPDPSNPSFNANAYFRSVNATARRKISQPVPDESMQKLKAAFEASRTAMMKLSEDDVHEGTQMQQTINRTVELGAEVAERTIQSYAPEDHAYAVLVSIPELSGVARLGTRINPAATLTAIRGVQDEELKTRLLLAVARTIQYFH